MIPLLFGRVELYWYCNGYHGRNDMANNQMIYDLVFQTLTK